MRAVLLNSCVHMLKSVREAIKVKRSAATRIRVKEAKTVKVPQSLNLLTLGISLIFLCCLNTHTFDYGATS